MEDNAYNAVNRSASSAAVLYSVPYDCFYLESAIPY